MQSPLKPEHRAMLDYGKARLGEAGVILSKLGACGEDCDAAMSMFRELVNKYEAYEREFFGPNSWNIDPLKPAPVK